MCLRFRPACCSGLRLFCALLHFPKELLSPHSGLPKPHPPAAPPPAQQSSRLVTGEGCKSPNIFPASPLIRCRTPCWLCPIARVRPPLRTNERTQRACPAVEKSFGICLFQR